MCKAYDSMSLRSSQSPSWRTKSWRGSRCAMWCSNRDITYVHMQHKQGMCNGHLKLNWKQLCAALGVTAVLHVGKSYKIIGDACKKPKFVIKLQESRFVLNRIHKMHGEKCEKMETCGAGMRRVGMPRNVTPPPTWRTFPPVQAQEYDGRMWNLVDICACDIGPPTTSSHIQVRIPLTSGPRVMRTICLHPAPYSHVRCEESCCKNHACQSRNA